MSKRTDYEKKFTDYPDVVTVTEFCVMLGGISDKTARKLLKEGEVRFFQIGNTFKIPKVCVIDYILGKHYAQYKKKLMVQV